MSRFYFVTGTDTEIGKTKFTTLVLEHFVQRGTVDGWKPIAAGATWADGVLKNEDALAIQAAGNITDYHTVNPIVFEPPIAPHIAARKAGVDLSFKRLNEVFASRVNQRDVTLVEGAGGWNLPLNEQELLSDWVANQGWPVIIVVGMRLGCLNHALLTAEAIRSRGLKIAGWVANYPTAQPMQAQQDNLDSLSTLFMIRFAAPLLLTIPYFSAPEEEQRWLQKTESFATIENLFGNTQARAEN